MCLHELCVWASGASVILKRALGSLEFVPLNHLWSLWILKKDLIMHVCVYVNYFSYCCGKIPCGKNQLKEGNLFCLRGSEGEFMAAGESWWLNVGQEVDRSLLSHTQKAEKANWR